MSSDDPEDADVGGEAGTFTDSDHWRKAWRQLLYAARIAARVDGQSGSRRSASDDGDAITLEALLARAAPAVSATSLLATLEAHHENAAGTLKTMLASIPLMTATQDDNGSSDGDQDDGDSEPKAVKDLRAAAVGLVTVALTESIASELESRIEAQLDIIEEAAGSDFDYEPWLEALEALRVRLVPDTAHQIDIYSI